MPAMKKDLTIEQGVDWSHGWIVKVNDELIDETWSARAQARTEYGELLHEFSTIVTTEGAVVIGVTPEQSSAWTWYDGKYDVEIYKDGNLTLRVSEGRVINAKEMTK